MYGEQTHLPRLSDLDRRDRYAEHVIYCKHCQEALRQAKLLDTWAPAAGLLIAAFARSLLGRLMGVGVYFLLKSLSAFLNKVATGRDRWEPMGTARKP